MKTQGKNSSHKNRESADRLAVLNFFLSLYKLQSGASLHEPSEFLLSDYQSTGPDTIYELRVKRDGKWLSRRMSISPLGEESGSKSKCFKVTYDDILVIKIPPVPIKNFDKYIESINTERRIADRLAPAIECIAPSVSSLLRRVPPFSKEADSDPGEFEKKCIRRLKGSPAFQEYLKIGDTFVFFMNLSKYAFLGNVIEKMHNIDDKIHAEIMGQTDILWDFMIFEEKYGSGNDSLFFAINKAYSYYEEKVGFLLKQHGEFSPIPSYHLKEWFLLHLAGKIVKQGESTLPPEFFDDMNELFEKLLKKNREHFENYQKMIKKYVYNKTFFQNKPLLGGIITNILELLSSLKERGVAIRDLKPDNVFIAADSEISPVLMGASEKYSIGLIDFETSINFKLQANETLGQPLLAATPSYATPSHLFKNEVLDCAFKDLSRILHLQDWQAAIAMIYNVVTGERLVEKTGRTLPRIMKVMRKSLVRKQPMFDVFKKSSRVFWQKAVAEFQEKMRTSEDILKAVETVIPENARCLFREEVFKTKEDLSQAIKTRVNCQSLFKNEKSRGNLIKFPHNDIRRYRKNWENGVNVPKIQEDVKIQIIKFLQDLEDLKLQLEKQIQIIEILDRRIPKVSVYELLEFMFNIVFRTMYRDEWGRLSSDGTLEPEPPDEDKSGEETVMVHEETIIAYEETILLEQE